jgi:hypothetical protein
LTHAAGLTRTLEVCKSLILNSLMKFTMAVLAPSSRT